MQLRFTSSGTLPQSSNPDNTYPGTKDESDKVSAMASTGTAPPSDAQAHGCDQTSLIFMSISHNTAAIVQFHSTGHGVL